jgi:hypothetical protein
MKKHIKKILFALVVVFISIQFIPKNYNESSEILTTDFMTAFDVPKNIETN